MKNRMPKSFLRIVTVLGLGLVLTACSSTPTEVVTLEDLIGQLSIQLASLTGNNGGISGSGGLPFSPAAMKLEEPKLGQIHVPFPGTPQVFQWPEVLDLRIIPRFDGHDTVLSWPHVDWPSFDILNPDQTYFGHSGLVYWAQGRWNAISTEWLRDSRERQGVRYPFEEKFIEGQIRDGDPIAYFIAGPWRHSANEKRFQRRSKLKWYTWPSLKPFAWPEEPEEPKEPVVPVIEEVHVYILGFRTQLSGGTIVDFAIEVGDVDLLALRDKPLSVITAEVPAGTYDYVEFTVDPARSFLVIDGDQVPLGVPVQNVRVNGPFIVGHDLPTTITIEFDPDKSLTKNADGSYTLNMVVVLNVAGA